MRATTTLCLFALFASPSFAEELLLEDYSYGGEFSPEDWANRFTDKEGNQNSAEQENKTAVVHWATKWSGLPSTGSEIDVTKFKSFQADVMVAKGQPVEDESNFYFQLLNKIDQGYSYWEAFVPQNKVPADGQWHRVTFAISKMVAASGDGGENPSDFKTIYGTTCGMTYDEDGSKFKYKEASFDNLKLLTDEVEEIKVEKVKAEEVKAKTMKK